MSFFDVVLRIRETRDFVLKLQKLLSTLLIHLPCAFGWGDASRSDTAFFWDLDPADNALMENIAWLWIASGLVMLEDRDLLFALLIPGLYGAHRWLAVEPLPLNLPGKVEPAHLALSRVLVEDAYE
ncbi:hypothetical protein BDV09DRAFT_194338 [Aspergillus tetrazonus]